MIIRIICRNKMNDKVNVLIFDVQWNRDNLLTITHNEVFGYIILKA